MLALSNNALGDGTAVALGSALAAQGRVLSGAAVDSAATGKVVVTGAAAAVAGAAAADNSSGSSGPEGVEGVGEAECSALRGLRYLVLSGKSNSFGVQGVTGLARGIQNAGGWLELIDLSFVEFSGGEEEVAAAAPSAKKKKGKEEATTNNKKKKGNKKKEKGAVAATAGLESMLRSAAVLWERRHRAERQQAAGEMTAATAAAGTTYKGKTAREMLHLLKERK